VPTKQRTDLALKTAPLLLRIVHLRARVAVQPGASRVRFMVAASDACSAPDNAERTLRRTLRRAVPFVEQVSVVVSPGGQALSRYTRSHCRSLLPAAAGHVVLSHRGAGASTSRVFDITTTSWNLDYHTDGGVFTVFVMTGKRILPQVVSTRKRTTGSLQLKGPGRFHLQVGAEGGWEVRVRTTAPS